MSKKTIDNTCVIYDRDTNIKYTFKLTDTLAIIATQSTPTSFEKWSTVISEPVYTTNHIFKKRGDVILRYTPEKLYELFVGQQNGIVHPAINIHYQRCCLPEHVLCIVIEAKVLNFKDTVDANIFLMEEAVNFKELFNNNYQQLYEKLQNYMIDTHLLVSKRHTHTLNEIIKLKIEIEELKR